MSILEVSLYAVIFIVALLLIVLILIQPSKSGGMGAAFGGIGESVFGGKAGSHLTKTTVIMTTIFFIVALGLAAVIGHKGGSKDEAFRSSMTVGGSGEKEPEKAAEAVAEKEEKESVSGSAEMDAAVEKKEAVVDKEAGKNVEAVSAETPAAVK